MSKKENIDEKEITSTNFTDVIASNTTPQKNSTDTSEKSVLSIDSMNINQMLEKYRIFDT